MSKENGHYLFKPERRATTHGAVIFLVNGRGEILYGFSPIDTERSGRGEIKLLSEAKIRGEGRHETIQRCLTEELGEKNMRQVNMPDNLRSAWLGSVKYLPGVNAQVFCFQWTEDNGRVPHRQKENHDYEANDFIAEGWLSLEALLSLNLTPGVRHVVGNVLADREIVARMQQIARGVDQ